jgi:plastocyanin domain-containing protein
MTLAPDQWIVTLAGLGLVALIVWFFRLKKAGGEKAGMEGGRQEAAITVKGGYDPDTIRVERGRPVRLLFRRVETAACSEMVVFPDFDKSAHLPTGETVAIDLLPDKPGTFEFSCQMGMLRGRLIVE